MSSDFLRRISIPLPCPESWARMRGDDRSRFCDRCKKNVYNLSSMTTEEAAAFLLGRSEPQCVRFYRRPDGTMLTSDCTPSWADARRAAEEIVARNVPQLAAASQGSNLAGLLYTLITVGAATLVLLTSTLAVARATLATSGPEMGLPGGDEVPTRRADAPRVKKMVSFGSR